MKSLRPAHEEDWQAGRPARDCRFTHVSAIARELDVAKTAIQQDVRRCRAELAEYWEAVEGGPPPRPLLIQNRRQKGYRLDPATRFVTDPEA